MMSEKNVRDFRAVVEWANDFDRPSYLPITPLATQEALNAVCGVMVTAAEDLADVLRWLEAERPGSYRGTSTKDDLRKLSATQDVQGKTCMGSTVVAVASTSPKERDEIETALLLVSPYRNPHDDPDEGRRDAALILRRALGI